MEQYRTPLYDELILHKEKQPISLHVPGHKNGSLFPKKALHEALKLDVTELTGLDDLHSPEGVIREAQQLLAKVYGVNRSFFLINGSTVGNLAMIMSAVEEDDCVLVQRNCHKSILNGLQLAKANPIFLSPEFDYQWNVAGGVTYETVEAGIREYPNAKALILTYPNYYGMVYDLKRIIELAHAHQMPVLVDEAHGAHFIAGNPFPASAVKLGADIVVQSAHKTLPAMTMGSFLHFNSHILKVDSITKYLQILQSSSPSYPIMASLDVARSYLGTMTGEDLQYLKAQVQQFRKTMSSINGIRVLPFKDGQGDILKVSIQSTSPLSGFELQRRIEKAGIYTELADPLNVLLILPLLKRGIPFPFEEITNRIEMALKGSETSDRRQIPIVYQKPNLSKLELCYKGMKNLEIKKVKLQGAVGKIAAEMITPYPPGIPLLFPGEIITSEDVGQIHELLEIGAKFQGGEALKEGYIQIFNGE
jgi:arginine/lysine/ornithine decarboxylase